MPIHETRRLASAKPGERLRVQGLAGDDLVARRLFDMGFWPGTDIEVVTSAPFGGGAVYSLRGFRVALRPSEAAQVLVGV